MDLLQKIDMFIGEDYGRWDDRLGKEPSEAKIAKMVKQHNISVKYGKKGTLNRPPKGYVKDNKGMYKKVSDAEWKRLQLGEGASDGKDFPAKKKKDDKSSEEEAQAAEKGLSDMEINSKEDGEEDPYDPETDLDKEKKQKELKKKAQNTSYVPAYSAS